MYLAQCCEYTSTNGWSNTVFYNSTTETDTRVLTKGDVEFELGKAGSFTFSLPVTNTNAEIFHRLTSFVDVKRTDESDYIFSGRVFDISKDFDDTYTITCEGLLALLNDVVIGPKSYKDNLNSVVNDIINDYNAQALSQNRFTVRYIDIDPKNEIKVNKKCDEYETVLSRLNDLVDEYGGYLQVTKTASSIHEAVFNFDWLDEEQAANSVQTIDFGENLLDLTQTETNTEDVATVLIPLGVAINTGDKSLSLQSEKSNYAFGRYMELTVREIEYSKADNSSIVEWTLQVFDNDAHGIKNYNTFAKITINNQVVYNQDKDYNDWAFPAYIHVEEKRQKDSSGKEVVTDTITHDTVSGTLTVLHDSNGSKYIPVKLEYRIYGQDEVGVVHGAMSLTDLSSTVTGNSVSITSLSGLNNRYYKLTVREDSYSAIDNSSVVAWTLEGFNARKDDIEPKILITIDGNIVYDCRESTGWNEWVFPSYLGNVTSTSGTLTIKHNEDGTKEIKETASGNGGILMDASVCTAWDGSSYARSVPHASLTLTPLGNKASIQKQLDSNLTIETASKSGGKKYIENTSGIKEFGRIVATKKWDDVDDPNELYELGKTYLEDHCKPKVEIELSAVDMSMVDSSIPRFKMGTKVRVRSIPHGITSELFMVRKQKLNLIDPAQDKMTIGEVVDGYIRKNRRLINYFQRAQNQQHIMNQITLNPDFRTRLISNLDGGLRGSGYLRITELDSAATSAGFIKDGYLKLNYLDAEAISANYITTTFLEANYITAQQIDTVYLHTEQLDTELANLGYVNSDTINANFVKTENLDAEVANVGYLKSDTAAITYATINKLESDYITANEIASQYVSTERLDASVAEVGYIKAVDVQSSFAQIDLLNVNNAWIENGVIKDAAISNEMINTVSANKLTAGTIDASKINVTNLQADNIKTGRLTVGGLTIDVDKSEASLDGASIEDGTISLSGLSDEVVDKIDGAIETFTSTDIPTLSNYPASEWKTDDVKKTHIGDVCYVLSPGNLADGYCYRFAYDNTKKVYEWVLIKDSDVTKALRDLITTQDDVSKLQTFQTETSRWIDDTDEGITDIIKRTTALEIKQPTINLLPNVYLSELFAENQIEGYNLDLSVSEENLNIDYSDSDTNSIRVSRNVIAINGITWTVNSDGSVVATGEASNDSDSIFYFTDSSLSSSVPPITIDPTKNYCLSGCPSGGSESTYKLFARVTSEDTFPSEYSGVAFTDIGNSVTFSGNKYVAICAVVSKGTKLPTSGIIFYPMLEVGNIASKYTSVHTSVFNEIKHTVDENSATITSLSEVLETKADGSAVSTLSDTVNSVKQTADSNASTISNLTTVLGTNNNGTTSETDIVHKYTSLEQNLDGFKLTVSDTYSTKVEAKNYARETDEASRNLIVGTFQVPEDINTALEKRPHFVGYGYPNDAGYLTRSSGELSAAEHGVRNTATKASRVYITIGDSTTYPVGRYLFESNVNYTISCDMSWNVLSSDTGRNSATTYYMRVYLYDDRASQGMPAISSYKTIATIPQDSKGTEMSGRCEFTFSIPEEVTMMYIRFQCNCSTNSHYAIGDFIELRNLKLNKGDVASIWTPAIEDIGEELDSTDQAIETVKDTISTVNISLQADIDGIKSTISQEYVTNSELSSEITSVRSSLSQTESSLIAQFESVNSNVDALTGEVQDAIAVSKSIGFDNGDLVLSRSNSKNNVKLTTEELQFNYGSDTVARVYQNNGESLIDITNAYVRTSLKLGNFEFIPRASGNLSFRKRT